MFGNGSLAQPIRVNCYPLEQWETTLNSNLTGAFLVAGSNWQLGNFYVRAERWLEALQTFQKNLVSPELRPASFDLARRGGQSNLLSTT